MYKFTRNKVKKKRYRIDMVFLSGVIVFAACFAIYMFRGELIPADEGGIKGVSTSDDSSLVTVNDDSVVDSSSSEEIIPAETSQPVSDVQKAVNPVPLSEKKDMSYIDSCVFVGDSLTVGLSSYNVLSYDKVLASIGMNINKVNTEPIKTTAGTVTIKQALLSIKPANIYIMLGSNGVAFLSNETMITEYITFVNDIRADLPDSKIYVISIPPVTAQRETTNDHPIQNADIDVYNSELLKMANDNNLYFIDLNTALKNNEGKVDPEKVQNDGMHFTKDTYMIMLDYILTHVAS